MNAIHHRAKCAFAGNPTLAEIVAPVIGEMMLDEVRKLKHDHPMKSKKWPRMTSEDAKEIKPSKMRPLVEKALTCKPIRVDEIAEQTGVAHRAINDVLTELRHEGLAFIVQKNRDQTLLWSSKDHGEVLNECDESLKALLTREWATCASIHEQMLKTEHSVTQGLVSARLRKMHEKGLIEKMKDFNGRYWRAFWRLKP